ncbi:MAG: hypothetical protein ACUVQ5_00360 [Candidatus Methanomethylicaceae archaeon]
MIALTKLVEARAGKVAKLTGSGGYRERILLEKILEDGPQPKVLPLLLWF